MTNVRRATRNPTRSSIVILAIFALVGPASLRAQGLNPPSVEGRPTQSSVRLGIQKDTPQTTALRLSVAREAKRQAETAPDQAQKPTTSKQSWVSRHKGGLIGAAILSTIGVIVFVAIFTHSGD